jgi:hypothetical protein
MRVVRLFREAKIGEAVLDAQLQEVAREREVLAKELTATQAAEAARNELQSREEAVWQFCADLRAGLEHAIPEEKQGVLRAVVDRVEVDPDGDHGTLYGVIPLAPAPTVLPPRSQNTV